MVKCEWKYCKHNEMTGICKLENISLRCATAKDLIDEEIVKDETKLNKNNCSDVLICEQYETMN